MSLDAVNQHAVKIWFGNEYYLNLLLENVVEL